MKITSEELKWIGVDFDHTLCESYHPDYEPQEPLPGAVSAMKLLAEDGWKLTIYTARPWSDYSTVEEWLNRHDIPFRRIVCGKLLCKYMIDDRAIEFTGDWGQVLDKIKV